MLLQYELQFQTWISVILRQRAGLEIDYQQWKRSKKYRYSILFILQMLTSDEEFRSIILIADNYCECTDYYSCFYCMLYDITQPMTPSAYLNSEILDLDEIENLL